MNHTTALSQPDQSQNNAAPTTPETRLVSNGCSASKRQGGQGAVYRRAIASLQVLLRTVYLSFVSALVAIALVLGIPADPETSQGLGVATIIVVVVGLISLLGVRQFSNRALECNSEEDLAESYRKSFFLGVAVAELAALVAFVASFVVGAGWLYLLGGAFSAIGFLQLAPTIGHLARRQEDLNRAGCRFSLRAAISRLPFRPR